ncbi:MAG: hypothetical protein WAW61_06945, partial [Methylococcaceae bacterium]
ILGCIMQSPMEGINKTVAMITVAIKEGIALRHKKQVMKKELRMTSKKIGGGRVKLNLPLIFISLQNDSGMLPLGSFILNSTP